MKRKTLSILCITLALTMVAGVTVMAAEKRSPRSPAPFSEEDTVSRPTPPQFASGSGFELKGRGRQLPADLAERFGIDTTGMTDEEIQAAVDAAMSAERENRRAEMETRHAEMLEELRAALIEKGVAAANMTEDELLATAKENGLVGLNGFGFKGERKDGEFPEGPRGGFKGGPMRLAEMFDIDTTNLTNEQTADAIAQAVRDWCMEQFNNDTKRFDNTPSASL